MASPLPGTVPAGGAANSTVTVVPLNGYSGDVTLSCTVLGGGAPAPSCAFNPGTNPVRAGSGTSTLMVQTVTQTVAGTYSVLVNGADQNGLTPARPVSLSLTVAAAPKLANGIPILETVYVPPVPGGTGLAATGRVTSLSYSGVIFVQPAESLEFRIRAPWPTTLQILINGQPLQQVALGAPPPSPDNSGYYTVNANSMPGWPNDIDPADPGYSWFFLLVDVRLPKQFRFQDINTSVPSFIVTLRDISQDGAASDLTVPMAGYPRPPFGPDLPTPPSTTFLSGENSKDDRLWPNMPRASLGIVAQDVTLGGWLQDGPQPGPDAGESEAGPGRREDWHFDLLLDPDFVSRNYPLANASPLFGATMPGQPDAQACWTVNPNYGCPCLLPGCAAKISLTGGQVPNVGMFFLPTADKQLADLSVELNAWHTNGARGNAPSNYSADPDKNYANSYYAFDVQRGVIFPPVPPGSAPAALQKDDYVIVTGTLWQDSSHDKSTPDALKQCINSGFPGHAGWLEIHPLDVVRRVSPRPGLRKYVELVRMCGGGFAQYSGVVSPLPQLQQPHPPNSVLRFQEIVDPRFTDPNPSNITKSLWLDPCYHDKVFVHVEDSNRFPPFPNINTYKSVVSVWWEKSDTTPPSPPCLLVNAITDDNGLVNLLIDGRVIASNVGNGGSTGVQFVSNGRHTIRETAGTGNNLSNYKISFSGSCGAATVIDASTIVVNLSGNEFTTCNIINHNRSIGSSQGCGSKQKCCETGDTKCALCWPQGLACP